MGLLKLLGLGQLLQPGLSDSWGRIAQRNDALRLDAVRSSDLALKENAQKVAHNLNDIYNLTDFAQTKSEKQRNARDPRLYDLKKAEFDAVASSIAACQGDGQDLRTDAMHLQMLAAETDLALDDSAEHRAKLEQARADYAVALVKQVHRDDNNYGTLAADLTRYIDTVKTNPAKLGAAMKALDALAGKRLVPTDGPAGQVQPKDEAKVGHPNPEVKKAAQTVVRQLEQDAQGRQKHIGPSTAERNAARMPADVLVHLMKIVEDGVARHEANDKLNEVATRGKSLFMQHQVDRSEVDALIDEAMIQLTILNDDDASKKCDKLKGQMGGNPKRGTGQVPIPYTPAQLQDNLTGRVFDSKFAAALVANPPAGMKDAAARAGAKFAEVIPNNSAGHKAAHEMRVDHILHDERPWQRSVPAFADIANTADDQEALQKIKTFLLTAPTTGESVVAMTYMMAKMYTCMKNGGCTPPWANKSDINYKVIGAQAPRDTALAAKNADHTPVKLLSEGAGITLLHQPPAVQGNGLIPSQRPTTVNRFGERNVGPANQRTTGELDQTKTSDAIKVAHGHALPFASGASGTTNILLHTLEYLNTDKQAGIDPKNFLLNAMAFVAYDGGHSLHEALWVANQTDQALGLNLGLGDPNKPNEFVSNYEGFANKFSGEMKTAVDDAMNAAWVGTQDYLQQHSHFADPPPPPAAANADMVPPAPPLAAQAAPLPPRPVNANVAPPLPPLPPLPPAQRQQRAPQPPIPAAASPPRPAQAAPASRPVAVPPPLPPLPQNPRGRAANAR
jgi:hypothetical protein